MAETQTWTIGRLLDWTGRYLAEHGSASSRLDAEVLLAHARGCRRIELYTAFEEALRDDVRTAFRELVRRRAEGTPVAYLVGRREFYSLDFAVTPDVLIPRPETEFLVIALLDHLKRRAAGKNADSEAADVEIADVGTGSGNVAIATAVHWPACRMTATDISGKALEVARRNAKTHGVAERMEFVEGNLLASVPRGRQFDYIVSNPPYVATPEMQELPRDVAAYEPRVALEAGPTGLEVIRPLAEQAAERLRPGGWLLMEVSPMIDEAVAALFKGDARWQAAETIRDLASLPRVVQAQRK